jgi:hypothetical protein
MWVRRSGSWLQMNRLSLGNNRLKFETAGEIPIVLEEFIGEYTPIFIKENQRMSTCSRLDLQTLGSRYDRLCPKISPIIALEGFGREREREREVIVDEHTSQWFIQYKKPSNWYEMTLNYRIMVERNPNLKEEVGSLIPGCEISSLPDGKICQVVNCLMCFGVG